MILSRAGTGRQLSGVDDHDEDDSGFEGYVVTAVDPGPWLLLGTLLASIVIMLVILPCAVRYARQKEKADAEDATDEETTGPSPSNFLLYDDIRWNEVVSIDQETKKILRLGIPYIFSNVSSQLFSNICLILVSHYIGTRSVVAYALVHILMDLTDGVLHGPIYACSTLCSHAVGAENFFLAGQYLQLAIVLYLCLNVPIVFFWWNCMESVILMLEWGDETTAGMAQEYIRTLIFSYLLGGLSTTVWQILDVTDHATEGAFISFLQGISEVAVIAAFAIVGEITLHHVGLIYTATQFVFLGVTVMWAEHEGWLKSFHAGFFTKLGIANATAVKTMIKTAVPISWTYLSSSVEWTVLTVFASYLGRAEVAAWAILGNIWDLLYYVSTGFGEAAEIRTSLHLGMNSGRMAKVSTFKSLLIGILLATTVSSVFFSLKDLIPLWYTSDPTLQAMLGELAPFVGVSNLAMNFGMDCWSVMGALAKYDLATWIYLMATWGICIPSSALFTIIFRLNLQSLMAACTIAYVTTGACMAFLVFTTEWNKAASEISASNAAEKDEESDSEDSQPINETSALLVS